MLESIGAVLDPLDVSEPVAGDPLRKRGPRDTHLNDDMGDRPAGLNAHHEAVPTLG